MNINLFLKSCFILFFVCLVLSHTKTTLNPDQPCKRIVLYYHDILFNHTDLSYTTSAKITNDSALGFHFGMMVVFDDSLTENDLLHSTPVARAQGFYFYDKKNAYNAWFAYTLIFNSSDYKGTLNMMGADLLPEKTCDFSVVGGTGDFFMARGVVTFTTDDFQGDYYFRLKMDIKLYECYKK